MAIVFWNFCLLFDMEIKSLIFLEDDIIDTEDHDQQHHENWT